HIVMDEIVTGCDLEGMPIKGDTVLPVAELSPGQCGRCDYYGTGQQSQKTLPVLQAINKIRDSPCSHDEKPYQGDVSVAVSHGLYPHLDKTNDRYKGNDEPEPSHRKIGAAMSGANSCRRYEEQN